MELFTSRTMILSRKLLGLHLILWIQPIALNSNTIHNNVQRSGGEERRMEEAITTVGSTSCSYHPTQKEKTSYQILKCLFIAGCLIKRCHASLIKNYFEKRRRRKKETGLGDLHMCRAHAFRCVKATSPNKAQVQ